MADHRDTLLLPFEKGFIAHPKTGEQWLMLNADVLPERDFIWRESLTCEQGFRPSFLRLETAGYKVAASLDEADKYSGALIVASRFRQINERNIIRAWNSVRQGGVILFAGDKTSGVQPARKWTAKNAPSGADHIESMSKHHAIAFWLRRGEGQWDLPNPGPALEAFHTAPGMFSHGQIDKGSLQLVNHFGDHIRGKVADFGAGWGYLSSVLLQAAPGIEKLDLYEADWESVEAARRNVIGDNVDVHWCDMTSEAPRGPFDWVIMNPPFHTGRAAEPDLGKSFIEAASKALPQGGRLLMVANRNLPYERILNEVFRKVEMKSDAGGFKVIQAIR